MVLELLAADLPHPEQAGELSDWLAQTGVAVRPALAALQREQPAPDLSHPAMAVNLDACIQCTRCVRACREEQVNDVIGMAQRGAQTQVVFDLGDPMGESSCVACGECVQACPTGALSVKAPGAAVLPNGQLKVDREVDSVCPFCGVGCLLTYQVQDATAETPERIVAVQGRDGPANGGRLCVKGRFGFDYVHHPERLTRPLVRIAGVAKDPAHITEKPDWRSVFREASWDEALALAAGGLKALREQHGPASLAGFGSAKGSNEEAYLFQKLVRTGFGNHNVDHCTRLCHASSVAALLEGVGSGAVSNPVSDVEQADFILLIGANPTSNHPVAASWMKNAAQRGARIVLADPRRTDIARHAWRTLQFRPDTDVALLNALLHVIFEENLVDAAFVAERVDHVNAVREAVKAFSPEAMAPVCGIDAATIARSGARLRRRRARHDPLGHGREPAHPRHRQRALPDRAGQPHRPDRPPRHRPAPAARAEQRAGRERRWPDPLHAAQLPAGGPGRGEALVRTLLGRAALGRARPHGGGNIARGRARV